jgi:hypothetical protein
MPHDEKKQARLKSSSNSLKMSGFIDFYSGNCKLAGLSCDSHTLMIALAQLQGLSVKIKI